MKNCLRYVLYCNLHSGIMTHCSEFLLFFVTFLSVPLFNVPLFIVPFFVPLFIPLFSVTLFMFRTSFHFPFLVSCYVPLFMFRSSFHVPFLFSVFLIFSVPWFPCGAHPRLLPKEMAEHLSPTQESPHPLHIIMPVIRTWAAINHFLPPWSGFGLLKHRTIHFSENLLDLSRHLVTFISLYSKNALKMWHVWERLTTRLKRDPYRDQKCFGVKLYQKYFVILRAPYIFCIFPVLYR